MRRVEVLCPGARHIVWGGDHVPDGWERMVCDECEDPEYPGVTDSTGFTPENRLRDWIIPDPPPKTKPVRLTPQYGVWTEHACERGSWDAHRWPDYRTAPPVGSALCALSEGATLLVSSGPPTTAFVLRKICDSWAEGEEYLAKLHDWDAWLQFRREECQRQRNTLTALLAHGTPEAHEPARARLVALNSEIKQLEAATGSRAWGHPVTGRISNPEPEMQNVPYGTHEGGRIRDLLRSVRDRLRGR